MRHEGGREMDTQRRGGGTTGQRGLAGGTKPTRLGQDGVRVEPGGHPLGGLGAKGRPARGDALRVPALMPSADLRLTGGLVSY